MLKPTENMMGNFFGRHVRHRLFHRCCVSFYRLANLASLQHYAVHCIVAPRVLCETHAWREADAAHSRHTLQHVDTIG